MSVSNRNYLLRTEAAIQTPTMRSAYPPRAAMVAFERRLRVSIATLASI